MTEYRSPIQYIGAIVRSLRWLRQREIDVIHMNRANDWRPAELVAARLARIPVVTVFHTVNLDRAPATRLSNVIAAVNVELAAARAAGLRVLHRSQALASLMAGSRRVAVAGANGKTTTTSMLVVALDAAGAHPSYACGAEIAQLATNAAIGDGSVFVVEADESDGSFLAYRPDVAVVTNVQPDHLDFYGTAERVEEAYAAFVATVPADGLVVACFDDPGSRRLAQAVRSCGRAVVTYGYEPGADLRVLSTEPDGLGHALAFRARRGRALPRPPRPGTAQRHGRLRRLPRRGARSGRAAGCRAGRPRELLGRPPSLRGPW
jgi:UDP-N-acetylmuramate--alanine ligase